MLKNSKSNLLDSKITALLYDAVHSRAFYDFEFFINYFFRDYCQYGFSQMHRDLFLEHNPDQEGIRRIIAAPRGHAKTTFISLFKVIHAIVYGYESYILIISHALPESRQKVRDIHAELSNNERLIEVFGALIPNKKSQKWNFETTNSIRIQAKSKGTQVRGLKEKANRPSLIILDDIESPEGVLSSEQRKKTKEWFEKDILKLGKVDQSSNLYVIGTCLHPKSLLMDLLKSPGYQSNKYQAVISYAENQNIWSQWEEIYIECPKQAKEFYIENQEAMNKGAKVLWPAAESYYKLMEMRIKEGESSFLTEKQNDPRDLDKFIFQKAKFKFFKAEEKPSFIKIIAYWDPALCQNQKSDYASILIAGLSDEKKVYILDCILEKFKTDQQINAILEKHKEWQYQKLVLESNGFQSLLNQDLEAKARGLFKIIDIKNTTNKRSRIAGMQPLIHNGTVKFASNINPLLLEQLELFPTNDYDDGPDALQGAIDYLLNEDPENLPEGIGGIDFDLFTNFKC